MNPLSFFAPLKALWSQAASRVDQERRAQLWAACANESCARALLGASNPFAGAAGALDCALAAHGRDAMESAMARQLWRQPKGEALSPAFAALGAPSQGEWMARLVRLAPASSFKQRRSTADLPPHAAGALKSAGLLPRKASPLLWLCAALVWMPEAEWSARFEAAQDFLEPSSPTEAAACMHLARHAHSIANASRGLDLLGSSLMAGSIKTAQETQAARNVQAWLEGWLLRQSAPALARETSSAAPARIRL